MVAVTTLRRRLCEEAAPRWTAWALLGGLCAYLVTTLFAFDNAATSALCWVGLAAIPALAPAPTAVRRSLTPTCAISLQVGAGVLMLWVSALTICNACAAVALQRAQSLDAFLATAALDRAQQRAVRAEQAHWVRQALAATPVPDHLLYRHLYLAYEGQLQVARDAADARTLNAQRLAAGQAALRRLDRDWQVLRSLGLSYTLAGQLPQARTLLARLVRVEPNSGEAHLLYAILCEQEERLPEAEEHLRTACRLDPTSGEFQEMLAHLLFVRLLTDGPSPAQLSEIVAHFDAAIGRGAVLELPHRLEYASALLLTHDTVRMVAVGRTLHGTPQAGSLAQRIRDYYRLAGDPARGAQLARDLAQ